MPSAPLNDDAIWGLPGAKIAELRKGTETFCETPLWELLCHGAAHDPDAVALVGRGGALRYGDMLRIAQNTAAALAERIAPGEAVACLLPRRPDAIAALIGALACGARWVLTSFAEDGAGTTLRLIERERVTCAVFQPPMLRVLLSLERAPAAFAAMRCLRIGAAGLPRADLVALRRSLPPHCAVWHTYASTEALFVASWQIPPDDSGPEATVAVGMPQPNHDYALLDEADRPVAPGEPGELVLRSRYLALGEWRQWHVVPGSMLPVPNRPGWRCFRTGDLLQVQPDGMLRLLGRVDRQVKINGVRIEPAEIEAVLRTEPAVTDAAVVAVPGPGSVTLHGFVASLEP